MLQRYFINPKGHYCSSVVSLFTSGLRRAEPGSSCRPRCERCPEPCRRSSKLMIRSCSEGGYTQNCIHNLPVPHQQVTRVYSVDAAMPAVTRPSPYTDHDYKVPLRSHVSQLSLDAGFGRTRVYKNRPRSLPRRYCRRGDVPNGDVPTSSSPFSPESPVREEEVFSAPSYCQVRTLNTLIMWSYVHAERL